jgi:hypothetical protein
MPRGYARIPPGPRIGARASGDNPDMKLPHRRRRLLAGGLLLAALGGLAALPGCSSPIPNRDPVGEAFPQVRGTGLDDTDWTLPDDLAGEPALLLIGYEQRTQFDIDRWALGLSLAGRLNAEFGGEGPLGALRFDVALLEVPTIPGLVPTAFSGWIDDGMRSGIPENLWAAVVTVYGDDAITEWTGTEQANNARVVLLDGQGRAAWFWDQGFSPDALLEMGEVLAGLK